MEGIKYDRAQCMASSWVALMAGKTLGQRNVESPQVGAFAREMIHNIADKHRQIERLESECAEAREEAERLRKILFAAAERLDAMIATAGRHGRESEQKQPLGK